MSLEERVARRLAAIRSQAAPPIAVELWNGMRYMLGDHADVTIRVPKPAALRSLLDPDFAALGRAYVEGDIDVDGPIPAAIRAIDQLLRRSAADNRGKRSWSFRARSRKSDAEAVRYHYDVSNDFYALWLDREMVYSCAYFRTGAEDLDTAQAQKLDYICRKLRLAPGDRLLDIGCGWGALVRWAAKHYGAVATGITLSHNQFELANARIRADSLTQRCRVLLQDYRDLPGDGAYDKIASVGMFEHVGLKNLPVYFRTIHRLLRDGGLVLNHGITSTDPESRDVGGGVGHFIDRYVFPQGELPHLSLVVREMGAARLEVMDVETLRLHYARTLAHWSSRFEANIDRARAMVGEKRLRIWRTYLAGCAYGFERCWTSIHQVLAAKTARPEAIPLPWTREDLYR